MLLSFVRLPHPAARFAAVEFDVRGGKRERGKEGEGEGRVGERERERKKDLIFH